MTSKIHKTAIINSSAEIGENVIIGPYSIIHENVKIGDFTKIDSHCVIHPNTEIGNNNSIHDHVIIGANPQDLKFDTNLNTYVKILDNNTTKYSLYHPPVVSSFLIETNSKKIENSKFNLVYLLIAKIVKLSTN